MANLNELLIGLGYAVQASISTPPATPVYWRLPNLNKKPWSQKVVNDDDRTEIGKGHEFPTQQWKSHYDNGVYTVERPASSEILAHALGFGLGSVTVTGSAAPYTYTIVADQPGHQLHRPGVALLPVRAADPAGRFRGTRSTLHRLRRERLEALR